MIPSILYTRDGEALGTQTFHSRRKFPGWRKGLFKSPQLKSLSKFRDLCLNHITHNILYKKLWKINISCDFRDSECMTLCSWKKSTEQFVFWKTTGVILSKIDFLQGDSRLQASAIWCWKLQCTVQFCRNDNARITEDFWVGISESYELDPVPWEWIDVAKNWCMQWWCGSTRCETQ